MCVCVCVFERERERVCMCICRAAARGPRCVGAFAGRARALKIIVAPMIDVRPHEGPAPRGMGGRGVCRLVVNRAFVFQRERAPFRPGVCVASHASLAWEVVMGLFQLVEVEWDCRV